MASEKNLNAVFSDIANSIRSKKGTTNTIQPINMADEISTIETGSNEKSSFYKALEAKGTYWGSAFCQSNGNIFQYLTEITESDIPPSSNVTSTASMFKGCNSLTTIPLFDTSNVTNMEQMFYSCYRLTAIPQFNTSKVTSMEYMFYECQSLTTIPQLDTSKVTSMGHTFLSCGKLTTIPLLDTSNVTNMYMMFQNCLELTTIPALDVSKCTSFTQMFSSCRKLTHIYMKNIKKNLNIRDTALEHDALVELINNGLATITTTQTLTMGSTKLALLSDSEKQVALDKGWTLA